MTGFRILLLASISLVAASSASIEDRLAQMHQHHPEADANRDGNLTEREAMDFVVRASGRRVNRGPADGSPEMLDAFQERSHKGTNYRLMQPLEIDPGARYPLIVSLHGGGGIGDDNVTQLRWWNALMAQEDWRRAHPSFVVVPQAVPGGTWGERSQFGDLNNVYIKNMIPVVFDLIESHLQELPIDRSRVYVLGASMGGQGHLELPQGSPGILRRSHTRLCGAPDGRRLRSNPNQCLVVPWRRRPNGIRGAVPPDVREAQGCRRFDQVHRTSRRQTQFLDPGIHISRR